MWDLGGCGRWFTRSAVALPSGSVVAHAPGALAAEAAKTRLESDRALANVLLQQHRSCPEVGSIEPQMLWRPRIMTAPGVDGREERYCG